MVDLVLLQDPTAHRPPGSVDATLIGPAERLDQRPHVIAPVAQSARGIDALLLGAAERAQIGRDDAKSIRQMVGDRLPEAAGGQVAV